MYHDCVDFYLEIIEILGIIRNNYCIKKRIKKRKHIIKSAHLNKDKVKSKTHDIKTHLFQ